MIALKLDVTVDDRELRTLGRQMPFVINLAINETLLKAQAKQREEMERKFTIRRKPFLKLSVKITEFSKRTTLRGELAISAPGGRSDVFDKFEDGGRKRPKSGRTIAIPIVGTPVKRTERSVVPSGRGGRDLRPRALLAENGPLEGVFVRRDRNQQGGFIYQRYGKDGENIRALYTLVPRAKIDDRLQFEDTVSREVRTTFSEEFRKALDRARATSRR